MAKVVYLQEFSFQSQSQFFRLSDTKEVRLKLNH